jgi:electron transport complex protein RnfB
MSKTASVVVIEENSCIGCTKCIDVCPVDAIIGANKQSHSVLADSCIGCNLCLPACPVNCINIVEILDMDAKSRAQRAHAAKLRHLARKERLEKRCKEKQRLDFNISSRNMKELVKESIERSKNKKKTFQWTSSHE